MYSYPTDELQFIYDKMSQKERDLLISLLKEEKENIEIFKTQNTWVHQRIEIINSILSSLGEELPKSNSD